MKGRKQILAVLMALILGLGIMPALAEAPQAHPNLADLFKDVGTMRYDVQLTINPQAAALIPMLTGEMQDEESGSLISAVINAVNKLSFSVLANKDAVSATIGSQAAPVADIRAVMNQETFENHITTSMLPGLALSIDAGMIRQYMDQVSKVQVDPEEVTRIVQLHLQTVGSVLGESAAAFTPEEGNFTVEGYGAFTKRTQVTITTHLLADLLQKLADIYNGAPVHEEFIQKFITENKAISDEMDETDEIPDIGKMLDDAAKQGKAEPDTALLTGWVYENGESTYIDGATADGSEMPTKLDILLGNQGIKARMIGKGYSYTMGEEEPAAPDWDQIEKDILSGENYTDTLITLNTHRVSELPQMSCEAELGIVAGGTNIGLTFKAANNLDTMEGSTSLSLSLMLPEPLLTLTVLARPTDEEPASPALEGADVIVLKENGMTDEENTLLETSLMQAIPELLTRLGAALPEEGPVFMALLGELMGPTEEETPVEEPQPEVIEEPAEEPTPEGVEEPAPVNP